MALNVNKKALNDMSVWELSSLMDDLASQHHALEVQITEVAACLLDICTFAEGCIRDAKEMTGLHPYHYRNLKQLGDMSSSK